MNYKEIFPKLLTFETMAALLKLIAICSTIKYIILIICNTVLNRITYFYATFIQRKIKVFYKYNHYLLSQRLIPNNIHIYL